MKITGFLLLMLTACSGYSQYVFTKQWDKGFGGINDEVLNAFQQTSDGGYILAGWSNSGISGDRSETNWSAGKDDYWIIKIDSVGFKQWDKRFGTTGYDELWALQQTPDSGYLLAGNPGGGISGDKTEAGRGSFDYWVVKTDKNGNKLWDKTLGGTLLDFMTRAIATRDGGCLVGGYSYSGIGGDKTQPNWDVTQNHDDFWVVKLDIAGNKQWDKRFGGIGQDAIWGLSQTKDGGYILLGESNSDSSGNKTQNNWNITHGTDDAWVVKIDSLGNKQWDKRFGGTSEDLFVSGYETLDGGYILGGHSTSTNNGNKTSEKMGYWLVKIDSVGNAQWDKAFEGAYEFYSLAVTVDGGYLLCGHSYSNIGGDKSENNLGNLQSWVVKTDSSGNKQWDKTVFTSSSSGGIAIQTIDGCYAVANTTAAEGGYKSQPSWGDSSADYWVLKFCMEPFNAIDDRLETIDRSQIQVWPNPFNTDLSIALPGEYPTSAEFTLINPLGQTIYHQTETNLAIGYTKMLDLSYLPNGLYFLEVVVDGERVVKQIVKQ